MGYSRVPNILSCPQCPPNLHKLDGYFCDNEQVSGTIGMAHP